MPLAAWSLLGATLGIAATLAVLAAGGMLEWHVSGSPYLIMLCQGVATGLGYAFFFRLQQVGGPVFVSQLSYVNTAVGLGFAVTLFAERLSAWSWLALLLIVAGVLLVNRTTGRPARQRD